MEIRPLDQKIVQQFRTIRKRQILAAIPVVLLLLIMIFVEDDPEASFVGIPRNILEIATVVVTVGVVYFSLLNWRCPSCKGYLGKSINPKFCSKCGVQLRLS